jgi:hypothetical protein
MILLLDYLFMQFSFNSNVMNVKICVLYETLILFYCKYIYIDVYIHIYEKHLLFSMILIIIIIPLQRHIMKLYFKSLFMFIDIYFQ